jgi:hypothetical protein
MLSSLSSLLLLLLLLGALCLCLRMLMVWLGRGQPWCMTLVFAAPAAPPAHLSGAGL